MSCRNIAQAVKLKVHELYKCIKLQHDVTPTRHEIRVARQKS